MVASRSAVSTACRSCPSMLAAKATLVSPNFLFRIVTEREGASEPYRLNDHELATRLSYFLWSSVPDEKLLAHAAKGDLHTPAVLAAEDRRHAPRAARNQAAISA